MTSVMRSGIAVEPETRDRWLGVFYVVVVVGVVLGLVFGVREVITKDPVRLGAVRKSTFADGTPRAQVLAKNYTQHTYCVTVRITAVDKDGLTLATAIAKPLRGEAAKLPPGQSLNLAARLEGLTAHEIREKLSDYFAFVEEHHQC